MKTFAPLLLPLLIDAEIRGFSGYLEPVPFFLHYTAGDITAPGSVDLADLHFTTPSVDFYSGAANSSVVDIVLVHEPDDCAGCDWTMLGVGTKKNGEISWCCTAKDYDVGRCGSGPVDRLIIDPNVFTGLQRSIIVPGPLMEELNAIIESPVLSIIKSGKFLLIMANCNDNGRLVKVEGTYTLKSKHGYLPGDMVGSMRLFFVLMAAYAILATWFGYSLRQYNEEFSSVQPIEKWIFGTILLAMLEAILRSIDFLIWNIHGTRVYIVLYSGVIAGVSKHTISRCLLVMVGLGWGVVRNSAIHQYKRIVVVGIIYFILAAAAAIVALVAVAKLQNFQNISTEIELLGAEAILDLLLVGLNIIFLIWILATMTKTMSFLEEHHQNRKLTRYRYLRNLLLVVAAFCLVWGLLLRTEIAYHSFALKHAWIVASLMEIDYLVMITGVAILWRPTNRDVAYDMELPQGGQEGEEHELELTEEVPSYAMEEDEYVVPDPSYVAPDPSYTMEEDEYVAAIEQTSLPVEDGVAT